VNAAVAGKRARSGMGPPARSLGGRPDRTSRRRWCWHTTVAAGKAFSNALPMRPRIVLRYSAMANPTLVVLHRSQRPFFPGCFEKSQKKKRGALRDVPALRDNPRAIRAAGRL